MESTRVHVLCIWRKPWWNVTSICCRINPFFTYRVPQQGQPQKLPWTLDLVWGREDRHYNESLWTTVISNDLCNLTSLHKWCSFVGGSWSLQAWKFHVWDDNVIMYIWPFAQFGSWMDFIKPRIIEMGKGQWGGGRGGKLNFPSPKAILLSHYCLSCYL